MGMVLFTLTTNLQPNITVKNSGNKNSGNKNSGNALFKDLPPRTNQHAQMHKKTCVRGFEPPTFWSVAKRSIQLS